MAVSVLFCIVDRVRDPDVDARRDDSLRRYHQREIRGQYSDHRGWFTAQVDGVADNRLLSTKVLLPESMTDNCDLRCARLFIVRLEIAAGCDFGAEEREEI